MTYAELEILLRSAIEAATPVGRRALAAYALKTLARMNGVEDVIAAEFSPAAAEAFRAAAASPLENDVDTLTRQLATIDAGSSRFR